ncbi:MAG: serine hydrolase domain-containing protein [Gammaproteobacteria bacterium]|nr:serine hydrolase domain-containing protein [Gammaproteobacteria bacterium]
MKRSELEAFADGVIEAVMENEDVAGAVLGIVRGNEVILLEGYGESDVGAGTPVDPATTLFRPGSVLKLFTWIALMQLRDTGKLDFQTDINRYLEGVEVPATFDEPITIEHLMTHTPGFEDHVLGLFGRNAESMKPLADVLDEQMPTRVRPPGKIASYSNHGVGLAGLIVEQVSGVPWPEYIEHNILEPLEMEYTTMRQPLPEALAPHMSKGYAFEAGQFVQKDFEFVPLRPPAGRVPAPATWSSSSARSSATAVLRRANRAMPT